MSDSSDRGPAASERLTTPDTTAAGTAVADLSAPAPVLIIAPEEAEKGITVAVDVATRIDAVVAGIPVSDFPGLFHRHSPHHIRARAIEHKIMGGAAESVYRVVSPMSFEAKVRKDRRFIFAGFGDRLAPPDQAQRLWEHWGQPRISWYPGNHVGYLWSKQVSDFLIASLAETSPTGATEVGGG